MDIKLSNRARQSVRSLALFGLSRTFDRLKLTELALNRPIVHFPYLHSVPQDEISGFRGLLAELSRTHTLISYSEAVSRVLHGPIDRPYAAFSFDDGFKSNLEAAKALEDFGTTGMFFIPTNAVGIPTVVQARNFFGFEAGCDEPLMSWSDLEWLKSRGHEVGNHTVNHVILSDVSREQAIEEIGSAASILRERLGVCEHFAWPNGRFSYFARSLVDVVNETGHLSCASAERGAHSAVHGPDYSSLCIRRDHVMSSWPLATNRYFLGRAASSSSSASNHFPSSDGTILSR